MNLTRTHTVFSLINSSGAFKTSIKCLSLFTAILHKFLRKSFFFQFFVFNDKKKEKGVLVRGWDGENTVMPLRKMANAHLIRQNRRFPTFNPASDICVIRPLDLRIDDGMQLRDRSTVPHDAGPVNSLTVSIF